MSPGGQRYLTSMREICSALAKEFGSTIQFKRLMVRLLMPNDLPEIAPVDGLAAFPAIVEVILFAGRVAPVSVPDDGWTKVRKRRHPCNFLASRSKVLRSLPCSPISSRTWSGVMRCCLAK